VTAESFQYFESFIYRIPTCCEPHTVNCRDSCKAAEVYQSVQNRNESSDSEQRVLGFERSSESSFGQLRVSTTHTKQNNA